MAENKSCTESTPEIRVEKETNPTFNALKDIWRNKVEASQLFLPSELDQILTVWMQFAQNCLKAVMHADADEFYVDAAEIAAQKLKHFPNHGWKCLTIEFPFETGQCSEESLRHKNSGNLSTSSAESTNDVLGQVDFLMRLVASSLKLVKTALDSSFKPPFIKLKPPQVFIHPKKYLVFKPQEMERVKFRKEVLHGYYDETILPLQIANEVDDEFWTRKKNQTSSE